MRPLVPDGRPSEGCRRRGLMLAVWLSLWIQWSSAQGSGADLINTTVGQTVTLTAPVTENIASVSWHRGTTQTNEVKIFSYVVSTSQQYNGSQFSGREAGLPDGSMQIRDVRTSDTGSYTVKVTLNNGVPSSFTWQLRVYEPVTKPTVKYGSQYLMENQSSGAITCDTSGAAVTILWIFQNSQSLPPNFRLSDNNRILTILNVIRSNSGTYQCQAINPVSASMSDPKTLPVAYGPEHVKISPSDPQLLQAGAKLSLTCSAVSVPGAQYQWLHNGTDLQTSGNTYTIGKVTSKEKGNYTCVAKNPIMGLSATAEVSIAVNGTSATGNDVVPGLPGEAIAGIALGVLTVCTGVILLVYFFMIKKPPLGPPVPGSSPDAAQGTKGTSTSPKAKGNSGEIVYSSVSFVPKGATPMKPITTEDMVYAEVRR